MPPLLTASSVRPPRIMPIKLAEPCAKILHRTFSVTTVPSCVVRLRNFSPSPQYVPVEARRRMQLWAPEGRTALVDTLLAHGADVKAVRNDGQTPLHWAAEKGHSTTVDALLKAGADGTAKDNYGQSPADWAKLNKHPMIVAKCDPAFAKAEGEKLRKAFKGAKSVSVLSTRFNEPSKEALAKWYKANGIKKTKEVFDSETWGTEEVECDTDDKDGRYPRCTDPKMAASTTKLFLEEGKYFDNEEPTVEPGTCMVFDPNTTNAYIMDGNSNNANAIWLRNWREVGLENARKTGGWCIQVLVAGGMSEMQRAEESMARSEGVPVIKLHLDRDFVYSGNIGTYLEALFEAMKTKPKAVERTITYYPEAVELKGTVKKGDGFFVRER